MALAVTPGAVEATWKVTWDAKDLPSPTGGFCALPEAPAVSPSAPRFARLPLPEGSTRCASPSTSLSELESSVFDPLQPPVSGGSKNPRYKTEMCRNFKERSKCVYGDECQFAHGRKELRDVVRNTKYKTKPCQKYWLTGYCAYGPRCNFLHDEFLRDRARRPTNSDRRPHPSERVAERVALDPSAPTFLAPKAPEGAGRHGSLGRTPFKSLPGGVRRVELWSAITPPAVGLARPSEAEERDSVFTDDIFASVDTWHNALYAPSDGGDDETAEEDGKDSVESLRSDEGSLE